jgi:hypothetical protein
LLDDERMPAVRRFSKSMTTPADAVAAEPVAGSSGTPTPGANIRA